MNINATVPALRRSPIMAKLLAFFRLDERVSITVKLPYRSELTPEQRQELDEFLAGQQDLTITINPV